MKRKFMWRVNERYYTNEAKREAEKHAKFANATLERVLVLK